MYCHSKQEYKLEKGIFSQFQGSLAPNFKKLQQILCIMFQEDFFSSKKKREKKGKRRAVNDEIEEIMLNTLDSIPKPRILDLWPVTLTLLTVRTVLSVPAYVRRKKEEKKWREEMARLKKEEEERIAQEILEMGKILKHIG